MNYEIVNKKIKYDENKSITIKLVNDHFENAKRYNIPHAQLIIADIPYNLGNPVNLLKQLIKIFTDEGDVVIDPCCGSASTLRACQEINRSCYGFEIKKDFCKKAKEQMLNDNDKQLNIFNIAKERIEKAENE